MPVTKAYLGFIPLTPLSTNNLPPGVSSSPIPSSSRCAPEHFVALSSNLASPRSDAEFCEKNPRFHVSQRRVISANCRKIFSHERLRQSVFQQGFLGQTLPGGHRKQFLNSLSRAGLPLELRNEACTVEKQKTEVQDGIHKKLTDVAHDRFALRLLADAAASSVLLEVGLRLDRVFCTLDHTVLLNLNKLSSVAELVMWSTLVAGAELGLSSFVQYRNLRKQKEAGTAASAAEVERVNNFSHTLDTLSDTLESAKMLREAATFDFEELETDWDLEDSGEDEEDEILVEEVMPVLEWLYCLDEIESFKAVDLVWSLARSPHVEIREAVAKALGDFPCVSNGWIGALKHLTKDSNAKVKDIARASMAVVVASWMLEAATDNKSPKATSKSAKREPAKPAAQGALAVSGPSSSESVSVVPSVAGGVALATAPAVQTSVQVLELPDELCVVSPLTDRLLLRMFLLGACTSLLFEAWCIVCSCDSPLRFLGLGWVLGVSLAVYPEQMWPLVQRWRRRSATAQADNAADEDADQ